MSLRFTFILLALLSQSVSAGPISSGGGDIYAIEFQNKARELRSLLVGKDFSPFKSADEFEKIINLVLVESTDADLILEGMKKDALNYPSEQRIVLNRSAWQRVSNDQTRFLFVLHEYLGAQGFDDSRYVHSSKILSLIFQETLVCKSIFLTRESYGYEAGKIAINLSQQNQERWEDELFKYSIETDTKKLLLIMIEKSSGKETLLKAQLHPTNPFFDIIFPVATTFQIPHGVVTDVELECK